MTFSRWNEIIGGTNVQGIARARTEIVMAIVTVFVTPDVSYFLDSASMDSVQTRF
jgi:hypothetical protein